MVKRILLGILVILLLAVCWIIWAFIDSTSEMVEVRIDMCEVDARDTLTCGLPLPDDLRVRVDDIDGRPEGIRNGKATFSASTTRGNTIWVSGGSDIVSVTMQEDGIPDALSDLQGVSFGRVPLNDERDAMWRGNIHANERSREWTLTIVRTTVPPIAGGEIRFIVRECHSVDPEDVSLQTCETADTPSAPFVIGNADGTTRIPNMTFDGTAFVLRDVSPGTLEFEQSGSTADNPFDLIVVPGGTDAPANQNIVQDVPYERSSWTISVTANTAVQAYDVYIVYGDVPSPAATPDVKPF